MMLRLDQRHLFLDALRPPDGFRFDQGIGTTFTLDLLTLLVVPLSLSLTDVPDAGQVLENPVLLLDGLRHFAKRLTIFCQAGRIAVPRKDNLLFGYLEEMIVPVRAPNGGVFHPKVWLLRYQSDEGEVLYRLLSLSRNLTFDRSWDMVVRLEGILTDRQNAYSRNHPLGDFVAALPRMAVDPVREETEAAVATMEYEVRRVAFKMQWPFMDEIGFHPAGIDGYPGYRFRDRCWRTMVVSPFLSDRLLRRVTSGGGSHVLVSRPESIAGLKRRTREYFKQLFVLDDAGVVQEEVDAVEQVGEEIAGAWPEPSGLHAKLFIMEAGWDATWLIGSANATNAAFWRKNVEFVVELRGRASRVGIDKVIGADDDENAFGQLLRPFEADAAPAVPDAADVEAEKLAGVVRDWLLDLGLHLTVKEADADSYDLWLEAAQSQPERPPGEYRVTCWPITPREDLKSRWDDEPLFPIIFGGLSMVSLTPFIAFEIVAHVADRRHCLRFVLKLPIDGIPSDRLDHVVSAIISDRERFLRYLWLMLRGDGGSGIAWGGVFELGDRGPERPASDYVSLPLLETLVRALSRSPDKIEHVNGLIEQLKRTPQGRATLPAGFETLWGQVMETWRQLS